MSLRSLVILLVVVLTVVSAIPTKKSNFIEQEKSCRDVCGLCDCDGFYCEDECICECNLESDESEYYFDHTQKLRKVLRFEIQQIFNASLI